MNRYQFSTVVLVISLIICGTNSNIVSAAQPPAAQSKGIFSSFPSLPKMKMPSLPKWSKSKPAQNSARRVTRTKPSMAQRFSNSTKSFFSKTKQVITYPFSKKSTARAASKKNATIRPVFQPGRQVAKKKGPSTFAKLTNWFSPVKKKPTTKRTRSVNDFLQKKRPQR